MARAAPNRPRQFQRRSPEAQAPGRRPEGVFGRAAFGVRSCRGRAGVAKRMDRRPAFGLPAARRPPSGKWAAAAGAGLLNATAFRAVAPGNFCGGSAEAHRPCLLPPVQEGGWVGVRYGNAGASPKRRRRPRPDREAGQPPSRPPPFQVGGEETAAVRPPPGDSDDGNAAASRKRRRRSRPDREAGQPPSRPPPFRVGGEKTAAARPPSGDSDDGNAGASRKRRRRARSDREAGQPPSRPPPGQSHLKILWKSCDIQGRQRPNITAKMPKPRSFCPIWRGIGSQRAPPVSKCDCPATSPLPGGRREDGGI